MKVQADPCVQRFVFWVTFRYFCSHNTVILAIAYAANHLYYPSHRSGDYYAQCQLNWDQ